MLVVAGRLAFNPNKRMKEKLAVTPKLKFLIFCMHPSLSFEPTLL